MRALLIVDVQNDFCPGGALAVEEGDQVVPVLNRLQPRFDLVLASKDWHPPDSVHFEKWPVHCVRDTEGAAFHPELKVDQLDKILIKGTNDRDDGYSAFEATNAELEELLRSKGVDALYVGGIATDVCVKNTVLDAVRRGFPTYVIVDAVRGVDAQAGDVDRALEEMQRAGARIVSSREIA